MLFDHRMVGKGIFPSADSCPSASPGVSAVEAEWIPELLPQYCHFNPPLETPSPWLCSSTGTIRCHRSSTFCKLSACDLVRIPHLYLSECNVSRSCSPCGLAAASGGSGASRRPGALQTLCSVSPWRTGTTVAHTLQSSCMILFLS